MRSKRRRRMRGFDHSPKHNGRESYSLSYSGLSQNSWVGASRSYSRQPGYSYNGSGHFASYSGPHDERFSELREKENWEEVHYSDEYWEDE